MAVVPRESRIEEMKRLGLSAPLLELARGQHFHDCFSPFLFVANSMFAYGPEPDYEMQRFLEEIPDAGEPEPSVPDGPPFLPLWDQWECTTIGVWVKSGGTEFLEYFWDSDYRVIARTEQGLWCYLFQTIADRSGDKVDWTALAEAAGRVGFLYLDLVRRAWTSDRQNYVQPSNYYEDFRDAVSAEVDRLFLARQ